MHTHAVRTTEEKLAATIDEWQGPREPAMGAGPMPVVLHKGSRDYLVIVRHPDHDEPHDGHRAHGEVGPPVTVGLYDDDHEFSGWIEDHARTWVLYLDRGYRPAVLWLRRDHTGAVVGEPIGFDAASDQGVPPLGPDVAVNVDGTRLVCVHPGCQDPRDPRWHDHTVLLTGEPREEYLRWALEQRSAYWQSVVNARTTLEQLGVPAEVLDQPYSGLMRGIEWLRDQLVPPREWGGDRRGVSTRDVLAAIASDEVGADHAVYVQVDGRSLPAAGVGTCNGGHGLLIDVPELKDRPELPPAPPSVFVKHRVEMGPGSGRGPVLRVMRSEEYDDGKGHAVPVLESPVQDSYTLADVTDMLQLVLSRVVPDHAEPAT